MRLKLHEHFLLSQDSNLLPDSTDRVPNILIDPYRDLPLIFGLIELSRRRTESCRAEPDVDLAFCQAELGTVRRYIYKSGYSLHRQESVH